jgi:iron-sulfur cluster assembly protein
MLIDIDNVQTDSISLTPAAVAAVRELLSKRNLTGYALRVFISGGGCSGFQYGMALDSNVRDEDYKVEYDDVKVVVDEVSMKYLSGSTVDYVDELMGSGFKIENPNAVSTCGCGSSFRTKTETGAEAETGGCSCQ